MMDLKTIERSREGGLARKRFFFLVSRKRKQSVQI
jgi:hypothetical protein